MVNQTLLDCHRDGTVNLHDEAERSLARLEQIGRTPDALRYIDANADMFRIVAKTA